MTPDEMLSRFPEIPPALGSEPALARFGAVFDELLRQAEKPSNCSAHSQTLAHRTYVRLVSPMGFIRLGLSTTARTLERLEEMVDLYERDPESFRAELGRGAADGPGGCRA